MLKKILAGGLAAALTLSLLTGCSAPAADSSSPDSYEAQIPAAAQEDVVSYLTGGDISCKDNVMTVNGIDVHSYMSDWQKEEYDGAKGRVETCQGT